MLESVARKGSLSNMARNIEIKAHARDFRKQARIAEELMEKLEIEDNDLIDAAYVDLLLDKIPGIR